MRPDDLNQTSDEKLFDVIDRIVLCATAGTTEAPLALAPFLTLELLRRTHERIVQLINSGRSHLAKHKALARVMCGLTSIRVPPDERDVKKIGNHIDIWLRRKYIDIERKLCRNIRNKQNLERKRAELRNSCCIISPMGRVEEFFGPFEDQRQDAPGQIEILRPSPYVPYTHSSLPSAMSMLEMKEAVADAQRKASSAEADSRKERLRLENERLRVAAVRSRCKRAAEQAASARKLAKSLQLEKTDIEVKAARELREFARRAQQESKQRERDAEDLLRQERAKVLRLGCQVVAASKEAEVHARREMEAQRKAEMDRTWAETELRQREAEVLQQRADHARVERETAKSLLEARAKVIRLGSQVVAASQEAAIHAQREAKAIAELEQERARAEIEADLRRDEAAEERAQRRREERDAEKKLTDARAKLLRLGSQVTSTTQEAARLAREKEVLASAKQEKEREVEEAKAEREYLLQKAVSEAQARKECARQRDAAYRTRDSIKETSAKRLQAKKELADRFCSLSSEFDEVHMAFMEMREERDANAGAAKKLEFMPTWRHERKKGVRGGGLQLQFQHRLTVLEQHANGTPSSAIGKNIVSVVKKVAPWLEPVEPSRREIMQIGFELPTLEEALSARRTAAAHSVRLLGFDETSDLQTPVVTSNVQVQDVAGGPLHDVVLKAAYLSTRGGTSVAVASEIEDKCFARLRELLRLWRQYHTRMFPGVEWTGPDMSKCSLHRLAGGGAVMSDTCNAARKTKSCCKA